MRPKLDETTGAAAPRDMGAPELSDAAVKNKDHEYDAQILAEIELLNAMFTAEEIETGVIDRELPEEGALVLNSVQELFDRMMIHDLEDAIDEALIAMRRRYDHAEADDRQVASEAGAGEHGLPNPNLQLDTILRAASALGYRVQVVFTPKDGGGESIVAKPAWTDEPV